MSSKNPVIGILGGMGPYAGLDLFRKLHVSTDAATDQQHLPILLFSLPDRISDRTGFLFDDGAPSPVPSLVAIASKVEQAGATHVGIPCNTAHAPPIFDPMFHALRDQGSSLEIVHMIEETVEAVLYEGVSTTGVLSTSAVHKLGIYKNALEDVGLRVIRPTWDEQQSIVNPIIFDETYGIKAQSEPVTERARQQLYDAIGRLHERGAEVVILGCTEFPLAVQDAQVQGVSIVDPTMVLARSLIRNTYPERLLPPVAA